MTSALAATRRTFVVLVTALAGSWLVPAMAQDWREYRPGGLAFSVELPANPEVSIEVRKSNDGPIKATSATATFEGLSFAADHSEYPAAIPEDWLNTFREDMGKAGGKIVRDEAIVVTGVPGRELVIELDTLIQIMRFIITGNRLIQISVSADINSVPDRTMERHPAVDRFLRSFALLPPLAR